VIRAAIDECAKHWQSQAESQLCSFIRQCPSSKTETVQTLHDGTVIESSKTLDFIKRLLLNEQVVDINHARKCAGFCLGSEMLKVLCQYSSRAFIIDPFTLKVRRPSKPMRKAMQA
jgi:hypothetical protein